MHVQPDPSLTPHFTPSPSPWKKKFREMGLLQKQVAYAVGISGGHLSDLLSGYRPISDDLEYRFRQLEAEVKLVKMMDGADSCRN